MRIVYIIADILSEKWSLFYTYRIRKAKKALAWYCAVAEKHIQIWGHKMKTNVTKFLIGNSEDRDYLLETLSKAGINDKYYIRENGYLYLNTEGTLLSVELEENRWSGDNNHFYTLKYNNEKLVLTNQKIAPYQRYEIMHVTKEEFAKLPPSLLKQVDLKKDDSKASEKPKASSPKNINIMLTGKNVGTSTFIGKPSSLSISSATSVGSEASVDISKMSEDDGLKTAFAAISEVRASRRS